MQKTITIDEKEITFKSNASFAYTFKNQFGYDILTKLLPMISEILKSVSNIIDSEISVGEGKENATDDANIEFEGQKLYLNSVDKGLQIKKAKEEKDSTITLEKISEILENIYSLELTDIQNIIWTMAKIADKNIKEPQIWYAEFDEFDFIDILKELTPMLLSSFISKKSYKA